MFEFYKYQGAGNDFVMIDARLRNLDDFTDYLVRQLCDRHFGIGSDGLILLFEQDRKLQMKYFNSDGFESTMCGNGGRCFVAFARDLGLMKGNELFFDGIDGAHTGIVLPDGRIKLKMTDSALPEKNPLGFYVNTGSPHLVVFTKNIDSLNVFEEGRKLRHNPFFAPGG